LYRRERLAFFLGQNMSFTLTDLGSENFVFHANVWNWKAALELIRGTTSSAADT
jgi:hypothetical protein